MTAFGNQNKLSLLKQAEEVTDVFLEDHPVKVEEVETKEKTQVKFNGIVLSVCSTSTDLFVSIVT